jgi:hypothetical protein
MFSDLVWIFFRPDVGIMLRRFFEEAIDKMQFDVVDLLVLSVGHVEMIRM